MKILLLINTLNIGGAEKLVTDIALSNPDGFDVVVLQYSDTFYSRLLNSFNINYSYLVKGSLYNPFLIFKIIPILRKYKVIHVHLFPALYWVIFAKIFSFSNVKIIYTEHSTNNRRRDSLIFKIFDRHIYSFLSFIGCISESTRKNLINHLGTTKTPIKTIANGIDLHVFNDANVKIEAFNYFMPNDFILIQISSFRIQKDQKTLIRSLVGLPNSIKLLLVGDGILKDEHIKLVNDLELQERVCFLGMRHDIPELIKISDVSVLSSYYEGFGLAALEGMAMKKPVIATDVEGLSDVVGGAGLLFKKGSVAELQNHILKLYYNKKFYSEVAEKCFLRAQKYDINIMISKYKKIYKIFIDDNDRDNALVSGL